MAKSELEVLIKARNTAKAEFDRLNGQVNKLKGTSGGLNAKLGEMDSKFRSVTGMSLGFATAAGAAGMAVQGLVRFLKESVEQTVAYATTVDNMSRLLGINTEETSRLIQASDDLFISHENLQTALLAATRKGIDVSIEGLKGLSEEYLKLAPGVERGKFLMDNFGRSGAEMGKLMEKGAEGIGEATDAIADGLIITERSMVQIMNYKRSVDNLNDSWMALKTTVGMEVIPQLDYLMRQLTKGKDDVEVYEERIFNLNQQLLNLKKYGIQGGLSQEELAEQIEAVEGAINATYDEMAGYIEEQEALAKAAERTNTYMSRLTKELIYNQAAANLSADEAFNLAKQMGLIPIETELAMDSIATWDKMLKDGEITVEEYKHLVDLLGDSINRLPIERNIHIIVTGEVEESAVKAAAFGAGRDVALREGATQRARAGGGQAAGLTWVGEQGPELVKLPQGSHVYSSPQSAKMSGTVVNFYYSPALSLSDKTEAETKLIPIIRKALASV